MADKGKRGGVCGSRVGVRGGGGKKLGCYHHMVGQEGLEKNSFDLGSQGPFLYIGETFPMLSMYAVG